MTRTHTTRRRALTARVEALEGRIALNGTFPIVANPHPTGGTGATGIVVALGPNYHVNYGPITYLPGSHGAVGTLPPNYHVTFGPGH